MMKKRKRNVSTSSVSTVVHRHLIGNGCFAIASHWQDQEEAVENSSKDSELTHDCEY